MQFSARNYINREGNGVKIAQNNLCEFNWSKTYAWQLLKHMIRECILPYIASATNVTLKNCNSKIQSSQQLLYAGVYFNNAIQCKIELNAISIVSSFPNNAILTLWNWFSLSHIFSLLLLILILISVCSFCCAFCVLNCARWWYAVALHNLSIGIDYHLIAFQNWSIKNSTIYTFIYGWFQMCQYSIHTYTLWIESIQYQARYYTSSENETRLGK